MADNNYYYIYIYRDSLPTYIIIMVARTARRLRRILPASLRMYTETRYRFLCLRRWRPATIAPGPTQNLQGISKRVYV